VISVPAQPLPQSVTVDNYPPIWGVVTPTQASMLAAEAIGNLAGPGPAELAGDPALQAEDRAYAVVHYDTPDGSYEESFDALRWPGRRRDRAHHRHPVRARPQPRAGGRPDDDHPAQGGRGDDGHLHRRLPDAAVPDDRGDCTGLLPEWILGPNLLADTAIFGRSYDQQQWGNGFAIGFAGTPARREDSTAYTIYTWAFGGNEPPSNIYAVLEPGLREVFGGIHLAGPELTPETFRDACCATPRRAVGRRVRSTRAAIRASGRTSTTAVRRTTSP